MSETMNNKLVSSLSKWTNVDWGNKKHHQWSDSMSFPQRDIRIGFGISSEIGQWAIPLLIDFLQTNLTKYVCLFINFFRECGKWAGVLEGQIIDSGIEAFVLQITGEMDKNEKNGFIRLFTSTVSMSGMLHHVLAATVATNTGIDQELVAMVL